MVLSRRGRRARPRRTGGRAGRGLVDTLEHAGVPAFGPTRKRRRGWSGRSRTPASSASAMTSRHRAMQCSPTAAGGDPLARRVRPPSSAKATGLAAGKGVIVPSTRAETVDAIVALLAGGEIVLEERLDGEEVSLLAFCDGRTVVPMPPAQDHKRIGEGDTGPNTGGMGAYAPAPVCPPEMVDELMAPCCNRPSTAWPPPAARTAACSTPA